MLDNSFASSMTRRLMFFPTMCVVAGVVLVACNEENGLLTEASKSVEDIEAARTSEFYQAPWPPLSEVKVETFDADRTRDNVMVVLDMSGSMSDGMCSGKFKNKADAARASLKTWLAKVPEEANVGLVIFENTVTKIAVPLGRGKANRERLLAAVDQVHPGGGTPLSTAVTVGQTELELQAQYQQGYGTYRLVVVTDGLHSEGYDPYEAVKLILANRNNPIEIHAIGFCITDSALNLQGYTFYQSANNPKELQTGLESVLAETETFDSAAFETVSMGKEEK